HFYVACAAMFAGGGAWLSVLSGFNVAAQLSLPSWVRARAMSAYLLVFYGAIAAGSATWGAVAARTGTRAALAAAALGSLVLGLLARARFRLREGDAPDLSPTRHWPAPYLAIEPEPEGGPVLVTIEYRIDPARAGEFARIMRRVRRSRMRSGAVSWGLWVDASDPGRHVESFVDESWVEHLRHHERVTAVDRDVEAEARAFHIGPEPPMVSHFLAGGRE
ncbi:MAG TPA: MFS transporter, partial [Thermoanaerobaculia bacterium]|nr:MFS transporter [Thermoanaerobaculia bacterium]